MGTKKTSRLKKCILTIFYGLVLLFLYLVICFSLISPSLSIKVFGFQAYIVSYTGSMEPKLSFSDMIFVRKCDFDKLEKHDIITFLGYTRDGSQIVITHEIVEVLDVDGIRMYRTKGTANSEPDFIPVSKDGAQNTNTYIGKYVFKSTVLGNVVAFLKAPQGMLVITTNVCAIFFIYLLLEHPSAVKRLTIKDTHF